MRKWTRIVAVLSVVLLAGTVALALAAGDKRPTLAAIPTVVTDKSVATLAPAGALADKTSPLDASAWSAVRASFSASPKNDPKPRTRTRSTTSPTRPAASTSPDDREVVTPQVRDESDGDNDRRSQTPPLVASGGAGALREVAIARAGSHGRALRRRGARRHPGRSRARRRR